MDKNIETMLMECHILMSEALNYMEGHDYAIGIDSAGKMYRQDIAEENGEIEPYPIDDVIDTVCEWNYELILDADAHRNDPKDFKDYSEYQDKYDSLKADEQRLDRLFEKTCYAKEIDEMAAALVESFISHLNSRQDMCGSVRRTSWIFIVERQCSHSLIPIRITNFMMSRIV